MNPDRRRTTRLIAALTVAVLLAGGLVYTSFSASTGVKEPSELVGAPAGTHAQLTGTVVPHSVEQVGGGIHFRVRDRSAGESNQAGSSGPRSLAVTYQGSVPDPFRGGREIVLTGTVDDGTFVGEPETLTTKCPSKFTTQSNS